MALDDQFGMARIPIKPLAYINKDNAQPSELMIDYIASEGEEEPSYHMYIVDPENKDRIIDITSYYIKQAFGKSITVNIDGVEEPMTLHYLMNFIYKNFVYADNTKDEFRFNEDIEKVTGSDRKRILLRDVTGFYYTPVTTTDSIIDIDSGTSISEKLKRISKVGFSTDTISIDEDHQSTFEINYPFINYLSSGNYIELRTNSGYIDSNDYQIIEKQDEDGNYYGCTISFLYITDFRTTDKINVLFIYNSIGEQVGEFSIVSGRQIADLSIPINKLTKFSDSYILPDSTSVATSKSVYDLYKELLKVVSDNSNRSYFSIDQSTEPNQIHINLSDEDIKLDSAYNVLNILVKTPKNAGEIDLIVDYNNNIDVHLQPIILERPLSQNTIVKVLLNRLSADVIDTSEYKIGTHRYIHLCTDSNPNISFNDLSYNTNEKLCIYKNGIRLFEDLDYTINITSRTIQLLTNPSKDDKIIFESEYIYV